jgi:hypothetical protein
MHDENFILEKIWVVTPPVAEVALPLTVVVDLDVV